MIVDDHSGMRGILCRLLTAPDVEVRECANGSEAVEAFGGFQPDCVIMDVAMKEVNGLEATQRILNEFPDARIFLMSEDASEPLTRAAQTAGACGFLTKDRLLGLLAHQAFDPFNQGQFPWMTSE